jgi:hypothetical protein
MKRFNYDSTLTLFISALATDHVAPGLLDPSGGLASGNGGGAAGNVKPPASSNANGKQVGLDRRYDNTHKRRHHH